jgi:hypothetical protein
VQIDYVRLVREDRLELDEQHKMVVDIGAPTIGMSGSETKETGVAPATMRRLR